MATYAMAPAIAIIGLCGMILPRISNTKIYSKGGKYSINNVCEIQVGSQQNILLTFIIELKYKSFDTNNILCYIIYEHIKVVMRYFKGYQVRGQLMRDN